LKRLWLLTWREAQTQAYADAFLVIGICLVVATLMVPLMRKVAAPNAPSSDAH
jgi:DHA2 family multidrug resistance protein